MVNLLFIQGGSRWKFDTEGNVYTDSNFNEDIWDRYRSYCDHLTVILRREEKIYNPREAQDRFNRFDAGKFSYVSLPDIYRPVSNYLRHSIHKEIRDTIVRQVEKSDLVIIRSIGNFYTSTALKAAIRLNKPYLLEVTGFAFEGLWNHGLLGKIKAIPTELLSRLYLRNAPWAVYVSQALQKRYPCRGEFIVCSDVELPNLDQRVLEKRIDKINRDKREKVVLGTASNLDFKLKGQQYVIRALAKLKEKNVANFEYRLVGVGSGKHLRQLSEKLGVRDEVHVLGLIPHEQIFSWFDDIDIYIHPSVNEGFGRSIAEAMGRACPVIASDAGGMRELIDEAYLFRKKHVKALIGKIKSLMNPENQIEQAKRNFDRAHTYQKEVLDARRDAFYRRFVEENS